MRPSLMACNHIAGDALQQRRMSDESERGQNMTFEQWLWLALVVLPLAAVAVVLARFFHREQDNPWFNDKNDKK